MKPKNIFFDKNNRVKIGDFGLALAVGSQSTNNNKNSTASKNHNESMSTNFTHLEMLCQSANTTNSNNKHLTNTIMLDRGSLHSVGIGTLPYMAPEIHYDAHYTNQVDMFSFGVILFEMNYPMNTQSERVSVLEKLKPQKKNFPPNKFSSPNELFFQKQKQKYHQEFNNNDFVPTFPHDVDKYIKENDLKLIRRLLCVQPSLRPSAAQLLKSNVFGSSSNTSTITKTEPNSGSKTVVNADTSEKVCDFYDENHKEHDDFD